MTSGGSRIAIVTGAGQGVGRAVAIALADAGADVVAVGRTQAKLDSTLAAMSRPGLAFAADLKNPDAVRDLFACVMARCGGLDVLVNCAAEYRPFRLDEATDDQITGMIANSLTSTLFCIREAIPLLRRRGRGDIVTISSQSATLPQPFMLVYGGAKAALEAISQGLRFELSGEDLRIMTCQIGVVADTVPKEGFAQERARMRDLWRRTGVGPMYAYPGSRAEDVAAAVLHAIDMPRSSYLETIVLRGNANARQGYGSASPCEKDI